MKCNLIRVLIVITFLGYKKIKKKQFQFQFKTKNYFFLNNFVFFVQHAQIKQRHVLFNRFFFFGGKNEIFVPSLSFCLNSLFLSLKLFYFYFSVLNLYSFSIYYFFFCSFVIKINSFIPQNLFNIPHN